MTCRGGNSSFSLEPPSFQTLEGLAGDGGGGGGGVFEGVGENWGGGGAFWLVFSLFSFLGFSLAPLFL